MNRTVRSNIIINYALLAIVSTVIFYFSMNEIWTGDDVLYAYKITSEYSDSYQSAIDSGFVFQKIENVSDLIESQNVHYMVVNGRYAVHLIVQLFCGKFGLLAFSICNVIVWLSIIYQLMNIADKKISQDTRFLCLSIILIFLTFIFRVTPSVQINYVWVAAANLLFFRILFKKEYSSWLLIPLFIFSVIVGNGNEAFSSGIGVALLIYVLRSFKTMSLQRWFMTTGYGIGALLLITSPGAWHRLDYVEDTSLIQILISAATGLIPSIILIVTILIIGLRNKSEFRAIITDLWFYLIAFIVCLVFTASTGAVWQRPFCGANFMAVTILMMILKDKILKVSLLIIGGLLATIFWTIGYFKMQGQKQVLRSIEENYAISKTGEVYCNTQPETPLLSNIQIGGHLGKMEGKEFRILQLHLKSKYNKDTKLKVYPKFLEGKENVKLESQVVKVNYGVYLIIIRNGTAPTVNIKRGVDLGLFFVPYDVITPNFEKPIKEGINWKAYMVYDDMWLISNLDAEIDGKPAHE